MSEEKIGGATAVAKSPEEIAAEEALARVGTPPSTLTQDPVGRRIAEDARRAAEAHRDDVVREQEDGHEAVRRVAQQTADLDDVQTTTDWLLSDTQEVNTVKFQVRLGGSNEEPLMGAWIIRSIGHDVIRSAEREAAGNRATRRAGAETYDELKANLRVVVEGTVEPDLKTLARSKGLADPTSLLRRRFEQRIGVIATIASEIMALSGFDPDDVRAAGNS